MAFFSFPVRILIMIFCAVPCKRSLLIICALRRLNFSSEEIYCNNESQLLGKATEMNYIAHDKMIWEPFPFR